MINLVQDTTTPANKIKVIGVGGAGGNATKRMVQYGLQGVEFYALNTDLQVLNSLPVPNKLVLGRESTRGLGAGAKPEIGEKAAMEARDEIEAILKDTDMVFITAGMGGGTGTGASPIVAEIAKNLGVLVVGVVTTPFGFEGLRKMSIAKKGMEKLVKSVDTMIVIPNQNLLKMVDKKTSIEDAFLLSDDILRQGVQGISDIITIRGEVNVDFADVKTIMENKGGALMGLGVGHGENRGVEAVENAINSPLLENVSINGANGVALNITGGKDMTLFEVDEIANVVKREVDENATIIFGTVTDESMSDEVRVTVLATGFPQTEELSKEVQSKKRTFHVYTGEDLDVPTVFRKRQNSGAARTIPEEEDYDMPTFLRKQRV